MSVRQEKPAAAGALAVSREKLYVLLAVGFTPPERHLLRVIRGGGYLENITRAAAGVGQGPVRLPLQRLARWIRAAEGDVAAEAEAFLAYQRLFAGPEPMASPYEAAYLSLGAGGRVMVLDELRDLYDEAGFLPAPLSGEASDHIVSELEFMGRLCLREWAAWERGTRREGLAWVRREKQFLEEHLARWVRPFSDRVSGATQCDLYRALGVLAATLVTLDMGYVIRLLQTLERD